MKKSVDKWKLLCYYTLALRRETKYGRVVELVDSLDSGSSVHCGRAGSSPASPTKKKRTALAVRFLFDLRDLKGRHQSADWCKNSPVDCF